MTEPLERLLLGLNDHGPQRRDPLRPSPQEAFLASPADICIYGGAAGGGKSWAGVYEPLRWIGEPGFTALIIREYLVDIKQAGGLWSETDTLYPLLGGQPNRQEWLWRFPSLATIQFNHLDGDYRKRYQGVQATAMIFDEATHVEEEIFWHLLHRNRRRRGCKVRPYVRATCNPDADSWLAPFLAWWWHPETGYPIPERAGKVRWMVRRGGEAHWAATREQLLARYRWAEPGQCKSVQFIPAFLEDNLFQGADYRGHLLNLDDVQQERLLRGNWLVRYEKGSLFRREWFKHKILDEAPPETRWVRAWDLAATAGASDASYTAGVKIGLAGHKIIIGDLVLGRWDSGDVEERVKETAEVDGREVPIWICREKAGAGKAVLGQFVRLLKQHQVDGEPETGKKEVRLGPLSSQAKHGNVYLLRDSAAKRWNEQFFRMIERLPTGPDDVGDALAAGYGRLVEGRRRVTGADLEAVAEANPELFKLDGSGPRSGAAPREGFGPGRYRLR